jgi:hypothetical protein
MRIEQKAGMHIERVMHTVPSWVTVYWGMRTGPSWVNVLGLGSGMRTEWRTG